MATRPEAEQVRQDLVDRFGTSIPEGEMQERRPLRRLQFDFTCPTGRDPEEVRELLQGISGERLRLRPSIAVGKVYGQSVDDYNYTANIAGVCYPDKVPDIVKALAEAEVWTGVIFQHAVAKGKRGAGLSRISEGFRVSITPELKASYQR